MRKWLCVMAGVDYDDIVGRIVKEAPGFGVDTVRVYDDAWLKAHPFYEVNRWLWETEEVRGFGWHAWKPLLMLDTLAHAADDDVVGYLDGDTYPLRHLGELYDTAHRDGLLG